MAPAEFREARDKLGLSAAKLAEKLGVHVRTIWRWQEGSRLWCSFDF